MSPRVLIRCDASPGIGLGHLTRCLALASELRRVHACQVGFLMRPDALTAKVRAEGYVVHTASPHDASSYAAWLGEVSASGLDVLIADVRDGLPEQAIRTLRAAGVLTAAIDEPSDYRRAVDLAFYPPIPQLERLDWTGFDGRLHVGWPYAIVREEFSRHKRPEMRAAPARGRSVLVSFGGSDPHRMSERVSGALASLGAEIQLSVLVGAAYGDDEPLRRQLDELFPRHRFIRDLKEPAALFAEAELAIIAFGVTAYEMATLGVPALHYSLSEDHARSASVFAAQQMAYPMGLCDAFDPEACRRTVAKLLADPRRLLAMSKACEVADGAGSRVVAATIMGELARRTKLA